MTAIVAFRAVDTRSRDKRVDPMEGRTMIHRNCAVPSAFFLAMSLLLSGCGPSTPRPAEKGRGGGPVPVPWGIRVSAAAFSPDNRLLALG